MMRCGCGSILGFDHIEEWEDEGLLVYYACSVCGFTLGVEAEVEDASHLFDCIQWTDEAANRLDRLPPYLEPLVRKEVQVYARENKIALITLALFLEVQSHGTASWHPEAKARLSRIPSSVRSMARVELERTALERGMPEVTVALMEELKARYFGMTVQC